MKCHEARRLFGAFWDDETTQAEREWIESHFVACARCRREYDEFARTMEWVSTLPRHEASPDLLESTLARARRTTPAQDRIPSSRIAWVPLTAAAALLIVAATFVSQWIGLGQGPWIDRSASLTQPTTERSVEPPQAPTSQVSAGAPGSEPVAAVPDSIFDHADDIEFVLDPVTLRRGRAAVTRLPQGIQAEQAVISF